MATTRHARAGRREWVGFSVLLLPLLLVSMDVSVLYFAVPFISRELAPTSTQQLWIFDIYGFVLAGLLLTMGALGDRIGRRRLLLIGAAAFSGASLLAAYAGSANTLIAARAVLGVAGATLMPSTLGLVRNLFPDERQRGRAIGIWTAAMTGGIAIGPVLSGLLLERFWWGSVFLVNIPAMVMLLVLAPALVPESRDPAAGRFDLPGALLSLGAVLPVIWGIKELARTGAHPVPGLAIVAGLALGVAFVHRQRRPGSMIDLSLFRRRAFSGALLVNVLAMFAIVGFALFTTQYLQSVLGLSPLRAALWSLLPSVVVGGAAPAASAVAQRLGRAAVMAIGFLVAAAGFAVLALVRADSGLWPLLIGATVYAGGLVMVMALVTEVVLGEAPAERAGSVSGLLESVTEFAGALGMAQLGSLGAALYRSDMAAGLPSGLSGRAVGDARETLGGALAVAARLPRGTGDELVGLARDAFTHGMRTAALAAAGLMVLAAVLSMTVLRGSRADRMPAGGTGAQDTGPVSGVPDAGPATGAPAAAPVG